MQTGEKENNKAKIHSTDVILEVFKRCGCSTSRHGLVMDLLVSGEIGIETSINFSSEAKLCANLNYVHYSHILPSGDLQLERC